MAGDIKIRLVSELYGDGFNKAVAGLKKVEDAYNNYVKDNKKSLADAKGSITKMVKNYKTILESGMADAPRMAGEYFQAWSNAMIYNFTGGDSAKLKATLQKAISEITNIGGTDNLAYINMTEMNKNINEVANMYDEASLGMESASRRKQAMFDKEVVVLRKLGMQQEEYTLTMQNAKEQMMALSPSMRNYESEMQRLSGEYLHAKTSLEKLTAEQEKSKRGIGMYLGTIAKSYLAHRAVASAVQAVRTTLRESMKVAGEAEQIYNKLGTVFDGVADSAKNMATSISASIGVATSTASSALSTVGDLLQAQGMGVSESLETAGEWVKKFQDIINFKDINESLDEFSKNMMAGFLGNTRNLRSVGVVIKDSAVKAELAKRNMDKLTGSELELAKMNIRAEMTFKQLDNAMGATEREWDTTLAVNRRLNEAWKEYKENIGDTLNRFITPAKKALTELLNDTNKFNKASQIAYSSPVENANVYDLTKPEDLKSFKESFQPLAVGSWGFNPEDTEAVTETLEEWDTLLRMYNATTKDLEKNFDNINPVLLQELKTTEALRQAEAERLALEKERVNTLEKASDSYDKFQESILGITGVSFTALDFSKLAKNKNAYSSKEGLGSALEAISSGALRSIDSAIRSITKTELSAWGDVVAGELENLDTAGLFESKMESVAQLFTAVWNKSLEDGVIDEKEQIRLNKLKELYLDLGKQLDAYNAELERQKNITSRIDSMKSSTSDYQVQFEQLDMTNNEKALDNLKRDFEELKDTLKPNSVELMKVNYEYNRQVYWLTKLQKAQEENERKEKAKTAILEAQNSVLDVQKQIDQLRMTDEQKALDDLRREYENQVKTLHLNKTEAYKLWTQYSAQAKLLERLNKLTKDYNDELEAEEKRKTTIADYKSQGADYAKQLAQFGMSDREKTRDDLRRAGDEALKAGDYELLNTIIATARSFDALQKAVDMAEEETQKLAEAEAIASGWDTLKQNALGSMGTVGNAINTFTDGKGSVISDILTVLLDIFQQSKYWDEVVEIINNVIQPLLPLVHTIVYTLKNLEPVFELIASMLTAISLVVNTILTAINLVIDFFEWGWNWLKTAFHNLGEIIAHPLNKGARDWQELPKLSEYTKETKENYKETNREILDGLDRIANNTSKDNTELLKAYTKMRDNQMITVSEYDALVAGLNGVKYDRVHTYDGGTWQNTSGGNTIVYNGDMKFTIEGTNLSADEIAEAVLRKQQQWATTAQYH